MNLYEYFNTTNQTSPHYERHFNFVGPILMPTCSKVQALNVNIRCNYIRVTKDCSDHIFFFNYYELLYCTISPSTTLMMLVGVLLLLLVTLYLFMILGTTADGFFCPALTVVSRMLGMSENIAGVTLLAFGNGAPDFFTSLAGLVGSGGERNIFSDLSSGAFFVVSFVGGLILILGPFTSSPSGFMRDLSFLLLGILFIDYSIKSKSRVNFTESCLMLLLYCSFLVAVIIDQAFSKRRAAKAKRSEARRDSPIQILMKTDPRSQVDLHAMERISWDATKGRNHRLIEHFKKSIKPFNDKEWEESGTFSRVITILRLPIIFVLTFLIPVVDYEAPRHGWSKLLNCMHIVVLPIYITLIIQGFSTIYGVPIFMFTLPITVPLSVFIFLYTRTDIPPRRHEYLSIIAVLGSIVTIYGVAAEVVSLLDVLGVTTYRSNSFLGCTLLSWGNSMGDMVSNISMARKGYTMMGFSACLGGPLFSTLVTMGVSFLIKEWRNPEPLKVAEGTMGETCVIFLIIILFMMLLGASTTNFIMRRSIGIFMVFNYVVFLIYMTLGEFEIIHPYGSDHSLDLRAGPPE